MNISSLQSMINKYLYWLSLPAIGWADIIEIIIISAVVYQVLKWFQVTRAWTLFKGILILLGFALIAALLQLNTILWLLGNSLGVGITAVFIIFQPELRSALELLGRNNILRNIFNFNHGDSDRKTVGLAEKTVNEICKAAYEMGKAKTGALIVLENNVALGEYERTGINIDAVISSQLLINIFEHNTPLHDGAVIVRNNRILCATCYLPLTENPNLGKELGTRHRAALGISELSDSMTVVVSEETGAISVAYEGKLSRGLTREELKEKIISIRKPAAVQTDIFKKWKGLWRNETNDHK